MQSGPHENISSETIEQKRVIKAARMNASVAASRGTQLNKSKLEEWVKTEEKWSLLLQKIYIEEYIYTFEKKIASMKSNMDMGKKCDVLTSEERKIIKHARQMGSDAAARARELSEATLKKHVAKKKWNDSLGGLYIKNFKEAFNLRNNKMSDKDRAIASGRTKGCDTAKAGRGVSTKLDANAKVWGQYAKDFKESYLKSHQETRTKKDNEKQNTNSNTNKRKCNSENVIDYIENETTEYNMFNKWPETGLELESFESNQNNAYLPAFSAKLMQNNHDFMAEDFSYVKNKAHCK